MQFKEELMREETLENKMIEREREREREKLKLRQGQKARWNVTQRKGKYCFGEILEKGKKSIPF